jgi:AAA domain
VIKAEDFKDEEGEAEKTAFSNGGERWKTQLDGGVIGTEMAADNAAPPAQPLIHSSAEFVRGFVPPDYVVVGLLQGRFLYSFTGQTGSGKTSITLRLAASVAQGALFAGRETKRMRVLYAAAENPDDVRMRWIALAQHMAFDVDTIDVFFTKDRFKISRMKNYLRAEAERVGGEFGLVIVDTSPAFFEGDDENSRTQMGAHALLLRSLIDIIPGKPAVIANCHPTKNATDNLLPAGGGTFINEVDGNFTCAKNDGTTEMHWQGKFRGPEFAPISFRLKTVTHQDLKDSDGRLIPTVICEPISEQGAEEMKKAGLDNENQILRFLQDNPAASLSDIAKARGWFFHNGEADKSKAQRYVDNLKKAKLLKEGRSGRYQVTDEGKKVLKGEAV